MSGPRIIVVGMDFSERDRAVMEAAVREASNETTELHVLFVLERKIGSIVAEELEELPGYLERLERYVRSEVDAVLANRPVDQLLQVHAHVAQGQPAREIVHLAAHLEADLIVVGTHGRRGVKRLVLGSVAARVARTAGCAVLTARSTDHTDEGRADHHVSDEIAPICRHCHARRQETHGAELWCDQHAAHHPRAHVYHYEPRSNAPMRPWGFSEHVN